MTAHGPRRILVLLDVDGSDPMRSRHAQAEPRLAALTLGPGEPLEVNVVSGHTSEAFVRASNHIRLGGSSVSPLDRVLKALGAYRLRDALEGFPVGRLLNTLGPLAPSRVYWRTLKRSAAAMNLLAHADIVIAADLSTTTTAWIARRRGWVEQAYFDRSARPWLAHLPSAVDDRPEAPSS